MSERLEHKKDVESILRSKLSEGSSSRFEPPIEVWNNIEDAIGQERRKFYMPWLFFGGLVFILFVAFYFSPSTFGNQEIVAHENEAQLLPEHAQKIEIGFSEKELTSASDDIKNGNNSRNTLREASKEVVDIQNQNFYSIEEKGTKQNSGSQNFDEDTSEPNKNFQAGSDESQLETESIEVAQNSFLSNEKSGAYIAAQIVFIEKMTPKELPVSSLFQFPTPMTDSRDSRFNKSGNGLAEIEIGMQVGVMNSSTDYVYSDNGSAQRFQILGDHAQALQLKLHLPLFKRTNLVVNAGYNEVHFTGNYTLEARGENLIGGSNSAKQFNTEIPSYAGNISASFQLSKVGESIQNNDLIPINLSLNHGVQFFNFGIGLSQQLYSKRKWSIESGIVGGIVSRRSTIETPSGGANSLSTEFSTDSFDLSVRGNEASLSTVMPYINLEGKIYHQVSKKISVGLGINMAQMFNATSNNPGFNIDLRTYSGQMSLRYRL